MKTKILASIFAIVSMLMIVAVSWMPSASAWDTEGVETVDAGYCWAQPIEFFSGDYLTVSYTISIQNDMYIDVILLDEVNFNRYKNDEAFSYNAEGTDFNTVYKKVTSVTFYTHDNYYVVVDNSNKPPNGATPYHTDEYCTFHYTISANAHHPDSGGGSTTTWEDDEDGVGLLGILCVAVTGIIVIIVIVVGFILYDRQKKQKAQQQLPQPIYPPQQQPPPPPDYRPPQ